MAQAASACVVLCFLCGIGFGQDPQDDVRKILDNALELYKQGKKKEAYDEFEKAIQKRPSESTAFAWLDRVGQEIVFDMINSGDRELQDMGRRLINLAKPARQAIVVKAEVIKEMIRNLGPDQEWSVQRAAHFRLVVYGPWALPYLVPFLNEAAEDTLKSRVMLVLKEIGPEISLGVAECLDADKEKFKLMRQNACVVLGNIGDERAIPALKRAFEDPNELPEVKEEAHIALQKLTGVRSPASWKKATDYYYNLAWNFFRRHPDVIRSWERSFLFWKWDSDNQVLTTRQVPHFALNEQLAEEALYDLLSLDPDYPGAWGLLAMVLVQQAIEAEAAIKAAESAVALEELKQDELDDLKKRMNLVERVNVLAEKIGNRAIYGGIAAAMTEGVPAIAERLIDIAMRKGRAEELPPAEETKPKEGGDEEDGNRPKPPPKEAFAGYPLVDALTYHDKRVRFRAAEAILKIAPRERRLGWQLVVPNLAEALALTSMNIGLVIYDTRTEADAAVVNRIRDTFHKAGVYMLLGKSKDEGILQALTYPGEDAIFIQYKVAQQLHVREEVSGKKLVEQSVFDFLRDDVRTRHIPKFILCDNDEELKKAEEIFAQHIVRAIPTAMDDISLKRYMEEMKEKMGYEARDAKARADEISRRAAEALAGIDVETTAYPVAGAVPALVTCISPELKRDRSVRVAACRALGVIGDTRGIDACIRILGFGTGEKPADEENVKFEKPVRWEAAKALSRIFWRNRFEPKEEQIDLIKPWLNDGDYDIELAVGEALGNAVLNNKQRLDLEMFKRKATFNDRRGVTKEEAEQQGY